MQWTQILLFIISMLLIIGAQALVKGSYSKYRVISNKKGLTGSDVARQILDNHGLKGIKVVETKGVMTDHYDPKSKTIRLSSEVYNDNSIAAVSIAAHECGHAIQYKNKYWFIMVRGLLVPIVNLTSMIGYVVLVIGFITAVFNIAFIGIILLACTLVFQLITLPVEFNASKRAKEILLKDNLIDEKEKDKVSNMLGAAAMTYVASLIANLLEILRLFLMFNRNRD
jgi:Zn-dependent membrane protease YugP